MIIIKAVVDETVKFVAIREKCTETKCTSNFEKICITSTCKRMLCKKKFCDGKAF